MSAPSRITRQYMAAGLLAAMAFAPLAQAQDFPQLTGRVVDAADVLPPDIEARLTQKLEALETQSRRQLVIATLPSLQGYEISDYGYQLGRAWGIGSKDKNDGALLIVAPNERKVRIEVGYGLEGIVTDGLSSLIIQQQIVPHFRDSDMPGGIEAGTDALVRQLTLPDAEARQLAASAAPKRQEARLDFPTVLFLLFILLFVVIPMIRSMRGGGRRYGAGPVILWGPSGGGGGGSGNSWGGGGFGGGGGFSGGGGSFGGGGSSGSW